MSKQSLKAGNPPRPKSWEVTIDTTFGVRVDGFELPAPPNKSVAVLFLGLMHAAPGTLTRQELGSALYPSIEGSKRSNALRQALYNLRSWIGTEGCFAQNECVGLVGVRFSFVQASDGQGQVQRSLFPGLSHPWVDEFRRIHRARCGRQDPGDPLERWVEVIRDVAQTDTSEARGLLVGGNRFIDRLDHDQAIELFALTKPARASDPYSWDHAFRFGIKLMILGRFPEGLQKIRASYRVAKQFANPILMENSAVTHCFWLIETGDVETAGRRLLKLDRLESAFNPLTLANALACYFWNSNNVSAATDTFKRGVKLVEGADSWHQAHFWSNLAFFAAEHGVSSAFQEASAACESSIKGLAAGRIHLILNSAQAIQRARQGDHTYALSELAALEQTEVALWHPDQALYLKETAAVIEFEMGNIRSSRSRWLEAERVRKLRGAKLTPRLAAYRDLLFQ